MLNKEKMALEWICVPRCRTLYKNRLISVTALDHPLKMNSRLVIDSKNFQATHCSSISCPSTCRLEDSFINLDGTDPLTQFAARNKELGNMENDTKHTPFCIDEDNGESIISEASWSWNPYRSEMLNKVTTSEKITIRSGFLNSAIDNTCDTSAASIRVQRIASDKVIYRLNHQMDNFDDDNIGEIENLTQSEYLQLIKQLNNELIQSWRNDQRVEALKIVIQCIKTLSYPSDLAFYPSQFILITDILDMFGKLVYERLKRKSISGYEFYSSSHSEDKASNTCLNWFFKIASIRELLPRLYMEICLLRCYDFIQNFSYADILQRLNEMIRGISHPLVAIYVRCYLISVGVINHHDSLYIYRNFQEILRSYHMIFFDFAKEKSYNVSMNNYLSVYEPALNLVVAALAHKDCNYVLAAFKDVINVNNNGLLLTSILNVLKSEFISINAVDILKAITSVNSTDVPICHLLCKFGYKMKTFSKLSEDPNLLLKPVLQLINAFSNPEEYLNCVEAWSEFFANNFTVSEINNLFGEVVRRLDLDLDRRLELSAKQYQQLKTILFKTFSSQTQTELLLVQESFLPYLDLFPKDALKCTVCKYILKLYKHNSQGDTDDTDVVNTLLHLSRILNDSITAVTVAEEKALIAELICYIIRKVNFGDDMEHQLIFYVEVRDSFANLDSVYCALAYAVSKLVMVVYSNHSGKHTRKSHSFVKACLAFNYTTIPCITSKLQQMILYAHNGEVALVNLCYGQADANFEMALRMICDLPRSIEMNGIQCNLDYYLVCFIKRMLATLIMVPDSPDKRVLHMFRLLLESIEKCSLSQSDCSIIALYLHCLDALYLQSFEDYPYQISGVLNDALYGHNPKFIDEVNNLCGYVVEQILKRLPQVGVSQELPIQAQLASELLLRILRYADLEKEKIYAVSTKLWAVIINQEKYLEPKFKNNIIKTIQDFYNRYKDGKKSEGLRIFMAHLCNS